jgi:hypothetical protein
VFSRVAGYLYPALLTALVPIRSYILSRFFDEGDLKHLDPYGETEEEYHEEQQCFHFQKSDSFSEDDLDIPNRAEFRAQGIQKELRHRRQVEVGTDPINFAEKGHQQSLGTIGGSMVSDCEVDHGHTE